MRDIEWKGGKHKANRAPALPRVLRRRALAWSCHQLDFRVRPKLDRELLGRKLLFPPRELLEIGAWEPLKRMLLILTGGELLERRRSAPPQLRDPGRVEHDRREEREPHGRSFQEEVLPLRAAPPGRLRPRERRGHAQEEREEADTRRHPRKFYRKINRFVQFNRLSKK
jgi:hypothetical protein